jgi:hypothetical protein
MLRRAWGHSWFGQHSADQSDCRHVVREDPHDVGASADLVPINRRS